MGEVLSKCINPMLSVSEGYRNRKIIEQFLEMAQEDYGSVSDERIVDICVSIGFYFKKVPFPSIESIFGKTAYNKCRNTGKQLRYYEDQWLEKHKISRDHLMRLIMDRTVHPLAKFIYVPSEDSTKRRYLNTEMGYAVCQASTLGWCPLSEICAKCMYIEECKDSTRKKYPEIFRLREEYGTEQQ